ncbi:MAG: maleylpyruvate isomerase family mycothiol-dependent enzyme [Candidatus Poriferisodalaceae bacterium]
MTPDFYRTAFNESTTRITELAAEDHQAVIPHIPNWTAGNVIIHVGLVFSFADQSIRQDAPVGQQGVAAWANDPANQPDTDELGSWFQSVADGLNDTIWAHRPDDQVWTSSQQIHTAKFWMRRMTQEAAMHRWDLEAAHAKTQPINPELAVDGIDEFYDFFVAERLPEAFAGDGSVHLHATDAEGEWMVTRKSDGITVEKMHGKGDVAARGSASDLLLFVWNRKPHTTLETFGNTELLDEHQRLLQI